MPNSADFGDALDAHVDALNQTVDDCLALYRSSAEAWSKSLPSQTATSAQEATLRLSLMDDLARGLLIKIFLAIMQADGRFSSQERKLAQVLVFKLWGRTFPLDEIGTVLHDLIPMADKFSWYQLVRPFEEVAVLHHRTSELETIVVRFGNLIAKSDGTIAPEEATQLKGVLAEINRHLRPVLLASDDVTLTPTPGCQEIRQALNAMPTIESAKGKPDLDIAAAAAARPPSGEQRLQVALQSLENLIGLGAIKNEVRELTRFLRVQQQREQAGLPRTQVSLHTVFAGNPGTGKTSVARVLGEIFGALGIVKQGHLIEADRSALVAGYAGQTAERTNKIIDKALDGVLFIDEAYSLVSDQGDDPFGHEALQILLKRMEDDRDRLIVVLAGYPEEMERLLATNPGLASRFQRTFHFPDYTIVELCRIMQSLCDNNRYVLPAETRARLILGFGYLLEFRDEHFGNGRLVRNVFEQAIRRLGNRVADIAPLTKDLLTRLDPSDIVLVDVPESVIGAEATRNLTVNIVCAGCRHVSKLKATYLGRRVQCNKCQLHFTADWGEPIPSPGPGSIAAAPPS